MLFLQAWFVSIIVSIIVLILTTINIMQIIKKTLEDEFDEYRRKEGSRGFTFLKGLILVLIPIFNLVFAVFSVNLKYDIAHIIAEDFRSKKDFVAP